MNSRPALQTALSHRSIRKFKTDPIPAEVLENILAAGQMASTSSYMQCVSVIRVTDPAKRARIRTVCANAYQGKLGHHYVENCAEFLVFCIDAVRHRHFAPDAQTDWAEVLLTGAVDAALFAQNTLLCAESLGLGGVFIGSLRNDLPEIRDILNIPADVVPLFGLCLGYPDHDPGQRPRLPLSAILSENGYRPAADAELAAYNDTVRDYYKQRSNLDLDWQAQIRNNLCGEIRPGMLAFLQEQGFAKR